MRVRCSQQVVQILRHQRFRQLRTRFAGFHPYQGLIPPNGSRSRSSSEERRFSLAATQTIAVKHRQEVFLSCAGCPRALCSQAGSAGVLAPEEWPEHEFVKVAESSLECVSEIVSELGFNSSNTPQDFDIEFSQGVLTIALGPKGTYVLNTQTPNRQIWMSSPLSGPWRYAWNPDEKQWISTRDGHPLSKRLTDEFSNVFKEPVAITFNDVGSDV